MFPTSTSTLFHGVDRSGFEAEVRPHFSPANFERIMQAYRLSKYGHRNQFRDQGGRYFEHPKVVAIALVRVGLYDTDVIIAALLHDVIEDSYILEERDVAQWFGPRACRIIMKVTKLKKEGVPFDLVAYFIAISDDEPGTWFVKLMDRLHNLSTLPEGKTPREKRSCQKRKNKQVLETRQFILPLAEKMAQTPGYQEWGRWFIQELNYWCDLHYKPL